MDWVFVDYKKKKLSLASKVNKTLNRKLNIQPNVHVKDGETYTWLPGSYGKVTFGYQSVINIQAGEYDVVDLDMKTQVTFNFADLSNGPCPADVQIYTVNNLDIERDFKMNGVVFGDIFFFMFRSL